ncbi:MAG TPA: hypothetical protein VGE93_12275 [Bryobacteraceae bacterium]
MGIARVASCLGALSLSGCGLMLKLFPHRPTVAEAQKAIQRCGASPDAIFWRVTNDGQFLFGPKTESGPPVPDSVAVCLVHWGKWNRVEVGVRYWDERLKP